MKRRIAYKIAKRDLGASHRRSTRIEAGRICARDMARGQYRQCDRIVWELAEA